jgi:hypothetical protein
LDSPQFIETGEVTYVLQADVSAGQEADKLKFISAAHLKCSDAQDSPRFFVQTWPPSEG